MFSHVIYNRYSDNLAPLCDISNDLGTPATGYEPSWVADYNNRRPSKLNETTGAWLFTHPTAQEVKLVGIGNANFVEGLAVTVQRSNALVWTPGTPEIEEVITFPAWKAGRMPPQPWIDLSAVEGAGSYLYTRVAVLSANTVALSVGDIWLGSEIRTVNLQWDDKPSYERPQIEHKTDYRRLRYRKATTTRRWNGQIPADDATRDEVIDWLLDADGRPFLFIPEHAATIPECWWAIHMTTVQEVSETFSDANFLPMAIEEDGRGLEPTPSPLP